jgi:hypothetical protein
MLESTRLVNRPSIANPQATAKILDAVPMLDLQRQYQQIREDILAAVERVCSSQQFILGPEVEALEREIAALTGAVSAVGCASGTEALWLALVAAGVKPGDSVITTAFSFFASASNCAGGRNASLRGRRSRYSESRRNVGRSSTA